MTFMVNIGRFGGFYVRRNHSIRICLGWIAFTFTPTDIDEILNEYFEVKGNFK